MADETATAPADQVETQESKATGAVVPVADPAAGFLSSFMPEQRDIYVSFDPKTPRGRMLLQKCEEAEDDKLRTLIGEELVITDVYSKLIDFNPEGSAEVIPLRRVCLITADSKVYGTVADGVRESVFRLAKGHGLPPWPKGVKVKVRQKPTRAERVRLWLEEVFDAPKPRGAK